MSENSHGVKTRSEPKMLSAPRSYFPTGRGLTWGKDGFQIRDAITTPSYFPPGGGLAWGKDQFQIRDAVTTPENTELGHPTQGTTTPPPGAPKTYTVPV